jgi:hypothetical protein
MKVLGWQAETEKTCPPKDKVLLTDRHGKKVECRNNITNRPLKKNHMETLVQEILAGRWHFNAVTITIGQSGLVLNGQHRLLALILAQQELDLNPDKYADVWKRGDTINLEVLVAMGIREDDEVVNTIDTGKTRSLSDVLYRSEFLSSFPQAHRKSLAASTSAAVKLVQSRTGSSMNAYSRHKTHSGDCDFLERHPQILKCVQFIFEEADAAHPIYLHQGQAAGLLYLMSTGNSKPQEYYSTELPNEAQLDWSLWDKACEFWVKIAQQETSFKTFRIARANLAESGHGGPFANVALFIKAWQVFVSGNKFTKDNLQLPMEETDTGYFQLSECPTAGGIDAGGADGVESLLQSTYTPLEKKRWGQDNSFVKIGKPKGGKTQSQPKKKATSAKKQADRAPETPANETSTPPKRSRKRAQKAGDTWAVGDRGWVHSNDEDPYLGEVVCDPYETSAGKRMHVVDVSDKNRREWEVAVSDVRLKRTFRQSQNVT